MDIQAKIYVHVLLTQNQRPQHFGVLQVLVEILGKVGPRWVKLLLTAVNKVVYSK